MFYEYSKAKDVNFINLWPHLLKYADEDLYYDSNGHWTVLGNQRVAEGLFENQVFIEAIERIYNK